MGLGAYPAVTLARARQLRDRWEAVRAEGRDPIEARNADLRAARAHRMTVAEAVAGAFEARRPELRDEGRAGRWLSPVNRHVLPKLGKRPLDDLTATEVADVLRPVWRKHPEASRKALGRLGVALTWASAGTDGVDLNLPRRVKAILGDPGHVATNIPAMPWQDVPAFYATLTDGTPAQLALRLLILTAVRSRPVRFARVEHVEGNVWTIPGEGEGARMKGRKGKTPDFRVPLSAEAQRVVAEAAEQARGGWLFAGSGRKLPVISDMAMNAVMRRAGLAYRPHGFRSSFKTWARETDAASGELAEVALAHATESRVGRAYMRDDLFAARQRLANRWAGAVLVGDGVEAVEAQVEGEGGQEISAEVFALRAVTGGGGR
jgi:integrase